MFWSCMGPRRTVPHVTCRLYHIPAEFVEILENRPLHRSGTLGLNREVLLYDDAVRIEQAEPLLVSSPCVYDTRQRGLTAVNGTGRQ